MTARIDWVERLLVEWATQCTLGDGSGYPTKNVLHPSWSPPSGKGAGAIKAAPSRNKARAMHAALHTLSDRLRATVAVHYCLRLPMAEQAIRLGCSERAVHDRIARAHQQIAQAFSRRLDLAFLQHA